MSEKTFLSKEEIAELNKKPFEELTDHEKFQVNFAAMAAMSDEQFSLIFNSKLKKALNKQSDED